jgi:hypothetical protein
MRNPGDVSRIEADKSGLRGREVEHERGLTRIRADMIEDRNSQLCDLLLEFPLIGKKLGIDDDLALDVLIEDFDVVARLQPLGPLGRHHFEERRRLSGSFVVSKASFISASRLIYERSSSRSVAEAHVPVHLRDTDATIAVPSVISSAARKSCYSFPHRPTARCWGRNRRAAGNASGVNSAPSKRNPDPIVARHNRPPISEANLSEHF